MTPTRYTVLLTFSIAPSVPLTASKFEEIKLAERGSLKVTSKVMGLRVISGVAVTLSVTVFTTGLSVSSTKLVVPASLTLPALSVALAETRMLPLPSVAMSDAERVTA